MTSQSNSDVWHCYLIMPKFIGFIKATHAAPTAAVTIVITLLAWSLGWREWPLIGVFLAVVIGQFSVGWSNDAFDASFDLRSGRRDKPTVVAGITSKQLWIAACVALSISCVLSWSVAGVIGGSWHVFALAMAWLYNTLLSRTWWSWLPYALAFGAVPAFLTYGLNSQAPQLWLTLSFAIIGVSAHIANALPDIDSDKAAGVQGFVISLGVVRATRLCWLLLVSGTSVLAIVSAHSSFWFPTALVLTIACAGIYALFSRNRSATFNAIMVCVVIEVIVLLISA
jgi:4-hydroxybenzoate polyprenyltransferase